VELLRALEDCALSRPAAEPLLRSIDCRTCPCSWLKERVVAEEVRPKKRSD
jgi:hypothetical protein